MVAGAGWDTRVAPDPKYRSRLEATAVAPWVFSGVGSEPATKVADPQASGASTASRALRSPPEQVAMKRSRTARWVDAVA